MTIKEIIAWGVKNLEKKIGGSDSPILDSEILLCAAIKKPKEFIFAHPERKLTSAQLAKYKKLIARRAKREPIAYILGKKEFYGFNFFVSPAVLVPRPDTETLINSVLSTIGYPTSNDIGGRVANSKSFAMATILDIGTGSGAIAITLKKLLPKTRVFASDTSSSALAIAKKNAKCLGAKIIFQKSYLLQTVQHPTLHILANLPYLSEKEWQKCPPEIKKYEPKSALVGGKNGWELYEKLFKKIKKLNSKNITLIIEIGATQKPVIAKLAKKILKPKKVEFVKDLAKKWRVAKIII